MALEGIENTDLKNFVRAEVGRNQESRLQYREIIYRVSGSRRFYLACRTERAYVWQRGRFEGDIQYWRKVLSEPVLLKPDRQEQELRFYLTTAADFSAFANAMRRDLAHIEFADPADLSGPVDSE